ncbi:MAG: hypothetical protein IIB77_05240 [Proteobacteria bacterium]|nr:hypothetical protein [Pseudomonadota bacterium]
MWPSPTGRGKNTTERIRADSATIGDRTIRRALNTVDAASPAQPASPDTFDHGHVTMVLETKHKQALAGFTPF